MADIQLIDFPENDAQEIAQNLSHSSGLEVIATQSRWHGGNEDLEPDPSAKVIAFFLDLDPTAAQGLHAVDGLKFQSRFTDAFVVIFARNCSTEQLRSMTGVTVLNLNPSSDYLKPGSVTPVAEQPLALPFSRYHTALDGRVWVGGTISGYLLASHQGADGSGAAAVAPATAVESGTGWVFYPTFGPRTALALCDLVTEVLPVLRPGVFADRTATWAEDPSLWVGKYAQARARLAAAKRLWDEREAELQARVHAAREAEQEPLLALLTADGEELKSATMLALRKLGFKIEDADAKALGPGPQEDLWIWYPRIGDPKGDPFALVEVKGSKKGFKEDDVGALRKYRSRRVKQMRNVDIAGLFIGNAFRELAPSKRGDPYSPQIIEDAERDGDLLMTTWDLFRLVQAVVAGRLTVDGARRFVLETRGRLGLPPEVTETA